MKYCNICNGDFYVQERWNGSEWYPAFYIEKEISPEDMNCAECPVYLPLEENIQKSLPSQ